MRLVYLGSNGRPIAMLFTETEIPRIGRLAGKMGSRTGTVSLLANSHGPSAENFLDS
jgi:hypothetical protein